MRSPYNGSIFPSVKQEVARGSSVKLMKVKRMEKLLCHLKSLFQYCLSSGWKKFTSNPDSQWINDEVILARSELKSPCNLYKQTKIGTHRQLCASYKKKYH